MAELTFMDRYKMKQETKIKLVEYINTIVKISGELDSRKVNLRIKMAKRSIFGEIAELLFLIDNLYQFPVDKDNGDISKIDEIQNEIKTLIDIDLDFLDEVCNLRGNYPYIDKDYNFVKAVEPDIDQLEEGLIAFCEQYNLYLDFKFSKAKWDYEAKKLKKKYKAKLKKYKEIKKNKKQENEEENEIV